MKAYWVIGIVMAAGLCAHAEGCGVDVYVRLRETHSHAVRHVTGCKVVGHCHVS
jgi:hypothetical protein